MKTLTSHQMGQLDSLVDDLRSEKKAIEDDLKLVNNLIESLNLGIERYNTVLQQINDFRNEVAEAIEADWHDKEEDWFTSREGEEQTAWKDEWEQTHVESIDQVDDVVLDDMKHGDELLNLQQHA